MEAPANSALISKGTSDLESGDLIPLSLRQPSLRFMSNYTVSASIRRFPSSIFGISVVDGSQNFSHSAKLRKPHFADCYRPRLSWHFFGVSATFPLDSTGFQLASSLVSRPLRLMSSACRRLRRRPRSLHQRLPTDEARSLPSLLRNLP
jgi:hypothetical protein